jgi:hypothetical protein
MEEKQPVPLAVHHTPIAFTFALFAPPPPSAAAAALSGSVCMR